MRILCLADIHGDFSKFAVSGLPNADLCLIAGDLTNLGLDQSGQAHPLAPLKLWLESLGERFPTLVIPGNHDRRVGNEALAGVPNVTPIMDKTVEFEDLSIRGVSISPCYDMPGLAKTWDYMTLDHAVERAAFEFSKVDVIVSHCPPYGYLDQLTAHSPHIGSRELTACIVRQQPKLVVCGHVHESQGEHIIGETLVVNVARTWRIVDL